MKGKEPVMIRSGKLILVRLLVCVVGAVCISAGALSAQALRLDEQSSRSRRDPSLRDEGTNSLTVRVVDESGRPIDGQVYVQLSPASRSSRTDSLLDGYCDPKGYYSFNGLSPGEYTVSVSMAGFVPRRYDVQVGRNDQQTVTVQLQRAAGVSRAGTAATVSVEELGVPEKARKHYEKGIELFSHNDYKGAVKQLREALDIDSAYVAAENAPGLAYWQLGQAEDARQQFETAIRINPKFLQPYLNLAELLFERKDYPDAAAVLARGSKQQPSRAEPYFEMARVQFEIGDLQRAEYAAQLALAHNPSAVPEVHLVLANVDLRLQQTAAAAKHLQDYLAAAPNGRYAEMARQWLQKTQQTHTN